ncbi:MAG: hypothetical protein CVU84_01265 [Firmicutes bacterium HGW-Firmicutes-1]|jgi:hypothetical protein|nr:MAG: hypothetical protein CVU84_01265 [Firmicutes bacterium HGW-Firmicutes-1]
MSKSARIQFDSYDRLFPSQDFLQKDGFGNLIALPLQKNARKEHNTIFIDKEFNEIADQWAYLGSVEKIADQFVFQFIKNNRVEKDNVSLDKKSTRNEIYESHSILATKEDFPDSMNIVLSRGLIINKAGLSAKGINIIRRLASYSNPEFFSMQAMRMSTYGTPRIVIAYEEDDENITLPRGLESQLIELLSGLSVNCNLIDCRYEGGKIEVSFKGELREGQDQAFLAMNAHSNGVLSATTGFGKTVLGARLIAEKKITTLVLVHTKQLAEQWVERLEEFLIIDETSVAVEQKKHGRKKNNQVIGQLGGGIKRINGIVDIAIMQSMFDKNKNIKELINSYGMIIVESHDSKIFTKKLLSILPPWYNQSSFYIEKA